MVGNKNDEQAGWSAPPSSLNKLNSDAAFFKDGTVGLGFIVRNDRGRVLLSGSKRLVASGNSTMVEALAMRFGLNASLEAGIRNMIVETDSKNLSLSIRGKLNEDAYLKVVVDDIVDMAEKINCPDFLFAGRSSNQAAHALAHYGSGKNFEQIWFDYVPVSVSSIVLSDVRLMPNT